MDNLWKLKGKGWTTYENCLKMKVEDGCLNEAQTSALRGCAQTYNVSITLTLPNLTRYNQDYLQNTTYLMLQNCPSLSMVLAWKANLSKQILRHAAGDSCFACPGLSPGCRSLFSLPSLPSFTPSLPTPRTVYGSKCPHGVPSFRTNIFISSLNTTNL